MEKEISRLSIIWAIFKKDFLEIYRDKIWVFLSLFGLILYPVLYWVLPSTVDETLTIGVVQKDMDMFLEKYSSQEGFHIINFDSQKELERAIKGDLDENVSIGIVFPDDFLQKALLGEKSKIFIYTDTEVPKEIRNAMTSLIREMVFEIHALGSNEVNPEEILPVQFPNEEEIILGQDRVGQQIPFRDTLKPLLAILILLVESMALASLIAMEVQKKTIRALLITPVRQFDLFFAKALLGTLLAFSQVFIVLLLIGALQENAIILLSFVLMGSIMVTGIAFISGSAGKDFIGTLLYSTIFLLILVIPTFATLFPGSVSIWMKFLPTYGLVEGIMRSSVYSQGWLEVMPFFLMMVAWNIVIFGSGLYILKNRVQNL